MADLITHSPRATLLLLDAATIGHGVRVASFGAIAICRGGAATLTIDMGQWRLMPGSVVVVFPGETVCVSQATANFAIELLVYNAAMLREASMQIEHTIYSLLREDRCQGGHTTATEIVDRMMALLQVYARQPECACFNEIALSLLKAFFIGFHDWCRRQGSANASVSGRGRAEELFGQFMQLVEQHHRQWHSVAPYAAAMSITPKYLASVTRQVTNVPPKAIIDHYMVLQIKQLLVGSQMSVKQIAWHFHFSDVPFLCRYFKQHTGLTPQQFRRQAQDPGRSL